MKAAIVSVLAACVVTLGACATVSSDSAALSSSEMVAEFAAVSQQLRDFRPPADAATGAALGPTTRRSVVMRQVLGVIEPLWKRREQLRADLAARRQSLTAEDMLILIAEIDRDLAGYEDMGLAPSKVPAGSSRPFMRTQYTGTDAWTPPDPNSMVSRTGLESAGMRHSEWRRIYRLREEREALRALMRTRAISPTLESESASLRPASGGRA